MWKNYKVLDLGLLLLGVGLILGAIEVFAWVSWSPKLAWGFLGVAGVILIEAAVRFERLLAGHNTTAATTPPANTPPTV